MNDEQLVIRVAELLEWERCLPGDAPFCQEWWGGKPVGAPPNWRTDDPQSPFREIPNYPNDLNAMFDAEEKLSPERSHAYNEYLYFHTPQDQHLFHITARQRAEAFVAVMENKQ